MDYGCLDVWADLCFSKGQQEWQLQEARDSQHSCIRDKPLPTQLRAGPAALGAEMAVQANPLQGSNAQHASVMRRTADLLEAPCPFHL